MKPYLFSTSFRSPTLFHGNRNKLRWMEWFIAIVFVVSLLIASGLLIKASNAADLKIQAHQHLSYSDIVTIPGSMQVIGEYKSQEVKEKPSVIYIESEDSCELKKVEI